MKPQHLPHFVKLGYVPAGAPVPCRRFRGTDCTLVPHSPPCEPLGADVLIARRGCTSPAFIRVAWQPSWESIATLCTHQGWPDLLETYNHSAQPACDLHLGPLQRQGVWSTCADVAAAVARRQTTSAHVTFCVSPVNPDVDVLPGPMHRVQVGLRAGDAQLTPATGSGHCQETAYVYRPDGTLVGHIPATLLSHLSAARTRSCEDHPALFAMHTHGTLAADLAGLLSRYPHAQPKSRRSPALPSQSRWCLPALYYEAAIKGCSVSSDRLSSPLEVTHTLPSFGSDMPQDMVFGASSTLGTERWTGTSSLIRPPFLPDNMDASVRWAIASVADVTYPTLALFFLPRWRKSLYTRWLGHPSVHVIAELPAKTLRFTPVRYLTPPVPHLPATLNGTINQGVDLDCGVTVFMVANEKGLLEFYRHDAMQSALDAAAAGLGFATGPRIPQPRTSVLKQPPRDADGTFVCRPPRSFPAAPLPAQWRGTALPFTHLCEDAPHIWDTAVPLRWNWRDALYTDGACLAGTHGNILGAAFFVGHTDVTYTVNPCGQGSTNTIMRAELGAIEKALHHACSMLHDVHLWTDSLASIYMIRRILYYPQTLSECKHVDLLRVIARHLETRAELGFRTALGKVKSHIGVCGNELADLGAGVAAKHASQCDFTVTAPNDSLSQLPNWLMSSPLPAHAGDQGQSRSLADLGDAVKKLTLPALSTGRAKATVFTNLRDAVNLVSYPVLSNHMWQACSFKLIRTVLAVRYNYLWTSARAFVCGRAYMPGVSTPFSTAYGGCPLCGGRDSVGHILGGCGDPRMKARYIARHNAAVCAIQTVVHSGPEGNLFCVMDAAPEHALPDGVSGIRVPAWMLPRVPAADLARMRPDILFVSGLTSADLTSLCAAAAVVQDYTLHTLPLGARSLGNLATECLRAPVENLAFGVRGGNGNIGAYNTGEFDGDDDGDGHDSAGLEQRVPDLGLLHHEAVLALEHALRRVQGRCDLTLVEVGFCSDATFETRLTEKHKQHRRLVAALVDAGWNVRTGGARVALLGTAGTLFHPLMDIMIGLGVTKAAAETCLKAMHLKSVNTCHSIVRERRALERAGTGVGVVRRRHDPG